MTGGQHQTFDTALQFTQRHDPLSIPRSELSCDGEPDGDIGSCTQTRRWRWWRGPVSLAHRVHGLHLPGPARLGSSGRAMALLHPALRRGPGSGAKHETSLQARRESKALTAALTAIISHSWHNPRSMKRYLFIAALTASSISHAGSGCRPEGAYERINTPGQPASFTFTGLGLTAPSELEFTLHALGQRLPDGVSTSGAVSGRVQLSGGGCVGAFLEPSEQCAIFIVVHARTAQVHQFGGCNFGAAASADGTYKRVSPRPH
ncbi:hypothetical protein WDL1P1_00342 (plasmid) [Variovorax sp. WDL1]|nr:hypothetical protein CHC06_05916 [Variovorax sp. B2]PNG51166.1 hypothetical protein CHC07_05822 [Variovorax sp. B4]VTV17378.1 hypothetical protein WDL1P1_00342 [Variovorax sp. WDL1]